MKMDRKIDFHSHVLPQMDDGSDGVETSAQLLRELASQGMDTVCATSHYYRRRESIEHYIERRTEAYRKLTQVWSPDFPKLLPGAETAYFMGMAEDPYLDKLCLGGTRTLLVEMPFTDWSTLVCDEVEHLALDCDLRIVLAHPERYLRDHEKSLQRFAQAGVGFQVNADTLLHWNSRKAGLKLLEMTDFPVLGSDCHNLASRAPHIAQAREVLRKKLGEGFVQTLDSSMNELLQPTTI